MVRLQRRISGLELRLVERVVERLLVHEPETTAVLLTGSYAKGTAAVASDLDLMAITPSPRFDYRTWFEEQDTDPPLHISLGAETADAWLAEAKFPARWSLGFPAINRASYLWTDAVPRAPLGEDPSLLHPAAGPELEDFLDFVLKAKRSASSADELGLRWFAQSAASLAPTLLIPLNEERIVRDRRDALDAALSLTVAPDTYPADLRICLGLASASEAEMKAAVARLGDDLLVFLREHSPDVDRQPSWLATWRTGRSNATSAWSSSRGDGAKRIEEKYPAFGDPEGDIREHWPRRDWHRLTVRSSHGYVGFAGERG